MTILNSSDLKYLLIDTLRMHTEAVYYEEGNNPYLFRIHGEKTYIFIRNVHDSGENRDNDDECRLQFSSNTGFRNAFLSGIQILFLGLGGFPAGILADRFGSRMVLMVFFAGLVISAIWLYFSTSFFMAVIGLGFLGLVTGLYHPAGLKMVSHSPNVSRYMSYHGISGSLGLAAGPFYGSWISNWFDWRTAYLLLGCVAFLGLIFLILYHQDSGPQTNKMKLKFRKNFM